MYKNIIIVKKNIALLESNWNTKENMAMSLQFALDFYDQRPFKTITKQNVLMKVDLDQCT